MLLLRSMGHDGGSWGLLSMNIHAYVRHAWTWETYRHGHIAACVYGIGFIRDINSNAHMQHVKRTLVQDNIYSNVDNNTHNYVKPPLQFQHKQICKDYKDTTIMDDVETKYHASSNLFLVVVFMCCDIGGFSRFV